MISFRVLKEYYWKTQDPEPKIDQLQYVNRVNNTKNENNIILSQITALERKLEVKGVSSRQLFPPCTDRFYNYTFYLRAQDNATLLTVFSQCNPKSQSQLNIFKSI